VNPDRLAHLLDVAAATLDAAVGTFLAGLGAPSEVVKGHNDFATAVDLELERGIAMELTVKTGIPVHGEEFGGPDLASGTAWVLDPIDGTFNYSAGLSVCGMLLALIDDGEPVLGLTWLPLTNRRYAATATGPVLVDGKPLPALRRGDLDTAMIGYGTLDATRGPITRDFRLRLLSMIAERSARVRMLGSTGADLALTAAGVLGGAVAFSHHPWDNAAGVALVRAAGGVVTDLAGRPWTLDSDSVLAAAPGIHDELLHLARAAHPGPEGEQ
jgi:myo-inositol-1(or 4)-monophosphatase